MAVTGDIYKRLIFDGVGSDRYGVYITGAGVYNAPERSVELIAIPGRNGAFALDNGRFENYDVTYPAGIFADTEEGFAEAISEFRNYLCSRNGYCRLEDEYNPDEYRMAVYKSGLDVEPAKLKAGKFNITFNCKPQRFLLSGEELVDSIESGDVLENPTLFKASPLIEVEGYGKIEFNGFAINLNNAIMGTVNAVEKSPMTVERPDAGFEIKSESVPVDAYGNTGDEFTATVDFGVRLRTLSNVKEVTRVAITTQPAGGKVVAGKSDSIVSLTVKGLPLSGHLGSDASASLSCGCSITYTTTLGEARTATVNIAFDLSYSNSSNIVTVSVRQTNSGGYFIAGILTPVLTFTINSTVSLLGHPTYIDCDLGAAYNITDDVYISLNRYIDLGSELPKLAPGDNEITYSDTITSLAIVPRWWKL